MCVVSALRYCHRFWVRAKPNQSAFLRKGAILNRTKVAAVFQSHVIYNKRVFQSYGRERCLSSLI